GRALFREHGYEDIGMDHFALPTDELYTARERGQLHRNFMGYTVTSATMLIGLGVSAISDTGTALAQNEKELSHYTTSLKEGVIPVYRGHFLNAEDRLFRRYILDIACKGSTVLLNEAAALLENFTMPVLDDLENDGLITRIDNLVQLTPTGRYFLRNVCAAFDIYLQEQKSTFNKPTFSKSI
ncbi:MAG TPA: coproporphyrinogen III oxidase, partial [Flavihumibacter sp.]|nr:coproporphyrinogen III oxidase [Flavihumibacter sp.]